MSVSKNQNKKRGQVTFSLSKSKLRSYRHEQFDDVFIIPEMNPLPWHTFGFVLFLFHNKDMFIKMTLHLLIGHVDAKLFEAVAFGIFKSGNIQYSNVAAEICSGCLNK